MPYPLRFVKGADIEQVLVLHKATNIQERNRRQGRQGRQERDVWTLARNPIQ